MAKSALKIKVRDLRRGGESIKVIARALAISTSTASLWCRDIELSKNQIEDLLIRKEAGIRKGQLNGALVQKNKRLKIIEQYKNEGKLFFKEFSEKDFFVSGLTLYLAEGTKKGQVEFTNSDPRVVKFMAIWFSKFFMISRDRLAPVIFINQIHRNRDNIIKKFWSDCLGIPLSQFRKTVFLKPGRKKIYDNHKDYFGTLKLRILKSTHLSYRIFGLINGLLESGLRRPA